MSSRDKLSRAKDITDIILSVGSFLVLLWVARSVGGHGAEDQIRRAHREQAIQEEIRLFGRPLNEGE